MADLKRKEYKKFEEIKHIEKDVEFWYARELMEVLEYTKWSNFSKVIDRAMLACDNSGIKVNDQFAEVGKLITHAKGGQREIVDYKLTRYACYLIVQNSDPRKKVIALGQTYFAIQTRRQEVRDYFNKLDEDKKRLVVRGDIKQWNQMLAETAHEAGVITDKEFAIFQNAGYVGLYGGETVEDIHKRKGLKEKEKILDYMNSQELIANLFRISLADEKIKKEKISNKDDATLIHNKVGQEVRNAIKRVGGILPEKQPTPKKSIDEVAKEQIKNLKKKKNLFLDEWQNDKGEIDFQVDLISKLVEAREKKGYTQRELATLCNVKQPEIARIESLKCSPQVDTSFRLLASLGDTLSIKAVK